LRIGVVEVQDGDIRIDLVERETEVGEVLRDQVTVRKRGLFAPNNREDGSLPGERGVCGIFDPIRPLLLPSRQVGIDGAGKEVIVCPGLVLDLEDDVVERVQLSDDLADHPLLVREQIAVGERMYLLWLYRVGVIDVIGWIERVDGPLRSSIERGKECDL